MNIQKVLQYLEKLEKDGYNLACMTIFSDGSGHLNFGASNREISDSDFNRLEELDAQIDSYLSNP